MIDIITAYDGEDMQIYDTQTMQAANILAIQLGSLEYAKDLGPDLRYFLSGDFRFQNESFKAYCVEVLANRGINVSEVIEVVDSLFSTFQFNITPEETSTGLIAR